uniref:Uncharacterized protein n=1 Tax=Acrobeloides nanus TaxID=290746 RepID=A0A914EM09_9BILA
MRRTRLVRGQDGQSWDGQGLSAVKTDISHTDKGCPWSRRDGQGLSAVKTGRTRVVRDQDGTDKGCPRLRWDGQGLSAVKMRRTRVVRGQNGTDRVTLVRPTRCPTCPRTSLVRLMIVRVVRGQALSVSLDVRLDRGQALSVPLVVRVVRPL